MGLGATGAGPSAETLVFTNVNVVGTRNGRILPGMTVVVRDGTIRGFAKFGLVAETHHIRTINAAGEYIIPGLWGMDVRIGMLMNRLSFEIKLLSVATSSLSFHRKETGTV